MSSWEDCLASGLKGKPLADRLEIRSLKDEQKYLLIEGLARFQNVSMQDPLSYFQIAGIHGLPYKKWPDKDWNKDFPAAVQKQSFLGFCTHNSILFLPWHRPYLALFEATLYSHVNKIADGIPDSDLDKKTYKDYATNFRLPYWDWATRDTSSVFPQEGVTNEYTSVFSKDGQKKTWPRSSESVFVKEPKIPKYNPLHHTPFESNFPKDRAYDGIKFTDPKGNTYDTTVRYPIYRDIDGQKELQSQLKAFYDHPDQNHIRNPDRNLSERVAYVLLAYKYYGTMSNNKYRSQDPNDKTANAETWASLEGIHNTVHNRVGGTDNGYDGHMSGIVRSAYDPIFWLHHAYVENIDRLFAIWQALHEDREVPKEDTWVRTQQAGIGNWSTQGETRTPDGSIITRYGQNEDAKSKLYPFRDSATSWYDSDKTNRTQDFGYTYPETNMLSSYPISEAAVAFLRRSLDAMYLYPSSLIQQSKQGDPNAGNQILPQVEVLKQIASRQVPATNAGLMELAPQLSDNQTLLTNSLESKPRIKDLAPDNRYLEWIVNIKGERHTLKGKYTVDVFLDQVEEANPNLWHVSPNHVGTFSPLGQQDDTACEKCKDQQAENLQVTGQIPLTIALIERYLAGLIPDINEDTVVNYLTKNLHWRVNASGAILENRAEVPGLTVFVLSNEVTIPEDPSQLPVYADNVKIHTAVTTNRDGVGRGEGTGLTREQLPAEL